MMNIVELQKDSVHEIKPLWEKLNQHHGNLSNNFKNHYAKFEFEDRMKMITQKDAFAIFVIKKDNRNIGYAIVSVEKRIGEIDSIFIDSEYRRSGLGEKLVERSHAWLAERKTNKIVISVAEGNESVFPFYK